MYYRKAVLAFTLGAGMLMYGAQRTLACSQLACSGRVLRVYNSSPYTYIELTDKANPSCTLVAGRYFRIRNDSPIHRNVNAAALVALSSGLELSLRRTTTDATCTIQYSVLRSPVTSATAEAFSITEEESLTLEEDAEPTGKDHVGPRKR